jgi:hypothetical protein
MRQGIDQEERENKPAHRKFYIRTGRIGYSLMFLHSNQSMMLPSTVTPVS